MYSNRFSVDSRRLLGEMDLPFQIRGSRLTCSSSIDSPKDNSLLFSTAEFWRPEYLEGLAGCQGCLVLLDELTDRLEEPALLARHDFIYSDEPRFLYVRILKRILESQEQPGTYSTTEDGVVLGAEVQVGPGTVLEPGVFLDHGVVIGNNCVIRTGSRIRGNVVIGNGCRIGEGCLIGHEGLAVCTGKDGTHLRVPHVGGVILEDAVDVGAFCTIASGTIHPTILRRGVLTGERNQISHNCQIGEDVVLSGNVVLTGGVVVGRNAWLGPGSVVINGVRIGENARVALGSVVFKDVPDRASVMGHPARVFQSDLDVSGQNIPDMYRRGRG